MGKKERIRVLTKGEVSLINIQKTELVTETAEKKVKGAKEIEVEKEKTEMGLEERKVKTGKTEVETKEIEVDKKTIKVRIKETEMRIPDMQEIEVGIEMKEAKEI